MKTKTSVRAPNIKKGSRVQLYNVTKGLELDNNVVLDDNGYLCKLEIDNVEVSKGDDLRLRTTYCREGIAMLPLEGFGVIDSNGLVFLGFQEKDKVYSLVTTKEDDKKMKVRELIEKLKTFNQDAEVLLSRDDDLLNVIFEDVECDYYDNDKTKIVFWGKSGSELEFDNDWDEEGYNLLRFSDVANMIDEYLQ